jgi:hypothetical protein
VDLIMLIALNHVPADPQEAAVSQSADLGLTEILPR